ncbi:discoidin domain-containing protein [Streptomyces sp. NPDC058683]|uniref:galactose-binding domain-containing protein n=1 Tax=Streptomyces sp. NPDC058683 TaxID=3346597 RepID=UPI00364D8A4B
MPRPFSRRARRVLARLAGLAVIAAATLGSAPPLAAGPGAARADDGGARVHAAPDGHGGSCSARQPCSLRQAKASAARLAARTAGDVHVQLAGGTYRLDAPLRFGPGDSGRGGHRIVWEAAPGARPVVSGGVPIDGWHRDADRPALWSAPVPAGLDTRQLYADGQRIPRSSGASPVALTQTADGFQAADDTLASWRNPSGIEFVFDGGHGAWTQPRCGVAAITGRTVTMRRPCWSNMKLPSTPTAPDGDSPAGGFPSLGDSATPSRIENAYELLSPGTWYLDRARHTVYYQPRPGQDPAAMHFVAPVLEQLVTTSSTADDPLHDVVFRGITFAYTTWRAPSGDDGFVEMQATMHLTGPDGATRQGLCQYVSPPGSCPFAAWSRPPAAVDLVGTRNVSITGNVFEHLGGAGLGTYHGADHDLVSGNEITDVSGNGIQFGTTDDPQPTRFATDLAAGRPVTRSSGGRTQNPWWQVDLGGAKRLWQTTVTPVAGRELSDFWVFVSATPFDTRLTPQQQAARPGVHATHRTGTASGPVVVPTDVTGRYVMIQRADVGHSPALAKVVVGSGAEMSVGNTITDNYVHDVGVEYTGAVGIWAGYARATTISHNEISDLPYSGISFGWAGWHTNAVTPWTNPNIQADNVISGNVVHNVMGVRQDGGAIYTNGPQGQNLQHGLTIRDNVTFGNKHTNFAYYNDEGGAYIVMDGNVQYADSGSFNGGCSTTGHIVVSNSYRVGDLNRYVCDNVGTDFVDGGGNVVIPSDPGPGTVPDRVFAGAGLRPGFWRLTTSAPPDVEVVSPIGDGRLLVSGSGFTPTSTVAVDGRTAARVTYIGPNQLAAQLPPGVFDGTVTVTTPAGTSTPDDSDYTYDPANDIARGRPATQSSTAFDGPAAHAADGDTDGAFGSGSVSHTDHDRYAWWQVDLGSAQPLGSVNLWNRTDCCTERATDYWVFVSDTPLDHSLSPEQQAARPGVWSSHRPGTMGRPTRLPVTASGRYVTVQLSGTDYLTLAEVQVFPAR